MIICTSIISCDSNSHKQKTIKPAAEYNFDVPKGWTVEKFPFPVAFAPKIPYKGFEDLRFTPGWESTVSDQHWSYTFLWWLEGDVKTDSAVLNEHLKYYYFGLLNSNVTARHIPVDKVIQPVVTIRKTSTDSADAETYTGTIKMINYLDLTFSTITLNCVIHKRDCNAHTAILFQLSPKPLQDKVWQQLYEVKDSFKCR